MDIKDITPGMKIIPAGRKRLVEVVSVDNWGSNPDVWMIGHYGQGFNVSTVRTGEKVEVVA